MTMQELSKEYACSACLLSARLKQLRQLLQSEQDPCQIFQLKRRILTLTPMLTEMNDLAELTAHYYDRGYWRDEKYTV